MYFLDDAAPSQQALQAAVDAALSGDNAQLAFVVSLVRYTDGEGALNFGDLLVQLRRAVGSERFHRALVSLPEGIQASATSAMQSAEETRRYYSEHANT